MVNQKVRSKLRSSPIWQRSRRVTDVGCCSAQCNTDLPSLKVDRWLKNKLFTVENSPTARRGYHSAVGEKSCSYWSVWKKEISYRSLLLDADKKVFPCKAHWKFLATNLVSSWLPEAGFTKNRKLCKNQPLPIHPLTLPVDFGRNQTCHFLFWAGENPQHGSSFGRFRRESRRF